MAQPKQATWKAALDTMALGLNNTHRHETIPPGSGVPPRWVLKTVPPGKNHDPESASENRAETREARRVLCRECLHPVTREQDRTEVHGAHRHTFANPSGIVYTIGCFQSAEGCGAAGSPSDEFTWFRGFSWRVAVCTGCLAHLGWLFSAGGGSIFWGLILDNLIFPDHQ